jgi:hypothetical protein
VSLYDQPHDWRYQALYAAGLAAVLGTETVVLVANLAVAITWSPDLGMLPVSLFFGLFGALVPMIGLMLIGMPLAFWLGERLLPLWASLIGVGLGAGAGGLFAILWVLVFGWSFEGRLFQNFLLGSFIGAPTGFWWWFFYRRVFIRRAALEN